MLRLLERFAPGLLRWKVLLPAVLAGTVGWGAVALVLCDYLPGHPGHPEPFAGVAGLVAWGHCVAWIMAGEMGSLWPILADFDGPRLVVFVTLLIIPVTILVPAIT